METFECLSTAYVIQPPPGDWQSEFEVQAALFHELRNAGFVVRGEVLWRNPATRRCCRFDLVLYRDGFPFHAIEVKSRPVKHKDGAQNTRQGKRYREFGVPVTFVYGFQDVAAFMRMAEKWDTGRV